MSERNTAYQFISADSTEILQELTTEYERILGTTVRPASAEKLFLCWVASAIVSIRNQINYVGNQNLPSRAVGANLDELGNTIFGISRPAATPAVVTMQFEISEAQTSAVLVPAGTRVTPESGSPTFATDEDVYIPIGETSATVRATCLEAGTIGNGYEVGQINTCVDLYTYYESCTNTVTSDGGADEATDDEYYDLMVNSHYQYSTAGAIGSYEYHAKKVSKEIQDVVINSPTPGVVKIYAEVDNAPASSGMKALILEACNAENVRPLTDYVTVEDMDTVTYDIDVTYYRSTDSTITASDLAIAMQKAVDDFVQWEAARIGRDINPSKLNQLMVDAGAKRTVITSPAFTHLVDGRGVTADVPQLATVRNIVIRVGGDEDE